MENIQELITSIIASVGGIGGIIAIATTIIKTFGGNSVKTKLAAMKVELDKTLDSGLTSINEGVVGRVNTDITVDIGAKVEQAVAEQLSAQRAINERLLDENNLVREALSTILASQSEMRILSEDTRKKLAAKGAEVAAVKPVEHEVKPVVHITLAPEPEAVAIAEEPKKDKSRAIKAVL